MKKTLSINISGIIFHIEEDGYETLRKYLDSINRYFSSFDDSSEIIADIENRIAEIFLAKLNEGKQVITADDVQQLVATMGNVSDFKAAEENDFAESTSSKENAKANSTYQSVNKKLVRDSKRKVLGGVAAGFAHYFGVDPVWVRLIFVLLTLAGTVGFWAYILLWIVLPSESIEEETSAKKMFRDSEKKVLGGVASGVAAFFGTNVVVIRVLFVIVACFWGLGILLYIVLWFSLPEAKTITEKMEMQGEPVTLSNIESSVKKSLNEKDEEESTLAKIVLFPFRTVAAIIAFIGKILGPIFRVFIEALRVLAGLVIMLTGLALVLAIVVSFGILFGMISTASLPWISGIDGFDFPIEAFKATFPTWTVIAAFFVVFIPALFIQMVGSSIIAKRMTIRPMMRWIMVAIFLVSVLLVSLYLPRIILSFKEEGEYRVEKWFDINSKNVVFKINETGLDNYKVTDLDIKGYDGKQLKLIERFQAQGRSRKRADEYAQTISYNVQQSDSVITFDSNISFNKDAEFHAQRLKLELFVPYNQPFIMERDMWEFADNHVNDNWRWDFAEADEQQTWVITKEDGLQCATCPAKPKSEQGFNDEDQYGLKDFDELDIAGIFNLDIRQGDKYSIEISGSESERKKYKVERTENTLEITYNSKESFWTKEDENVLTKIQITMPNLKKLKVKGAGKLRIEDFNEDETKISLFGAMSCEANIDVHNLELDLSGPMVFELDGDGDYLEADVSKVAQLKASGYEVRHAVINAHEVGTARVNASEKVEIDSDITSVVKYVGEPQVIKK